VNRSARFRLRLAQWLAGLAAACGLAPAIAQGPAAWPQRNVQVVVPYTPGTGADILARGFGPKLAELWKVGVVTDNRPGATGAIGAEHVAKSVPDGHTALMTATSFATTPALSAKLPFDPVKSFAPVVQIASSVLVIVVHPQLPAKNMRDFIQLAKRRPGQLLYSSPGNGGPQHLTMDLIKLETGIDIVHVPYKGLAGAMTDLMGGHVQAMISATQSAAPYVHNGRMRALAVMSAQRSAAFPEVPTLKELGHRELANLEVETWYAMFAPSGTPPAVIAKLNGDVNAVLQQPEMRNFLAKQGMNPIGGSPERMGELLKSELARWQRVVTAAKIKAD
jgi:tripartite-type tricarboxylate transporter receptor subunit TctC